MQIIIINENNANKKYNNSNGYVALTHSLKYTFIFSYIHTVHVGLHTHARARTRTRAHTHIHTESYIRAMNQRLIRNATGKHGAFFQNRTNLEIQ